MPERRNLRSNKETSSANNERTATSKGKTIPPKKGNASGSTKEESGDKPQTNGTESIENGVNGSEDVEMGDEEAERVKIGTANDGDEEMTVVVPPPKSSQPNGQPGKDSQGDTTMEGSEKSPVDTEYGNLRKVENGGSNQSMARAFHSIYSPIALRLTNIGKLILIPAAERIDPRVKAVSDIKANFTLLERAVSQFDARFTLRVLRSMSSVRKHLSPDLLAQIITETYPSSSPVARTLLAAIGKEDASFEDVNTGSEMDVDFPSKDKSQASKIANGTKDVIPEIDFYLSILVQIYLYDTKAIEYGAKFSSNVVERLRTLNRRTLDALSARVYFYYSLFHERLAPLPPSPQASVLAIQQNLLAALRTSVLRKDQDTRATVTTLLLRNYLSTSHISQADLLISHSEFPPAASNNQIARYLYYLGRIRAIQLSYTEAHEHLTGATRKSPATPSAGGFYQAASKLLVVVELLMGDIPDRAIFRQPNLEHAMKPYLNLVQAVRVGKMEGFLAVVQEHSALFRRDGTYTLILRLRQNVIKTGIRMMSLSYARISLRDICLKLDLESEESAEYIVAKAIRDGVIEATLDHERGFMKSKDVGDIYATREPGEAFHDRIRACLDLHDESVKAMRFPMNQHRLELKNAQEAREREREIAKEIVEGDMDDDDAGADFEGM